MNGQFHADGGPVVGVIFLLFLIAMLAIGTRIIWRAVRSRSDDSDEKHEAPTKDSNSKESKDDHKSHDGHGHSHGHDKEGRFTKFVRGFASFLGILAVILIFGAVVWAAGIGTWRPKPGAYVPPLSTKRLGPKVAALPKGITMCDPFSTKPGERTACLASGQVAMLIPEGIDGDFTCWGSSFGPNELQVVMEDGSTVQGFDDTKIDQKAVAFIATPPKGKTRFYIYWPLAPTPEPKPCHITS